MKRKNIIFLVLMLMIVFIFSACENKKKTNVLGNGVKEETKITESKAQKFIEDGSKFLNEKKYDDAKSVFEKAISMDKSNKKVYIEIKDKYMEKQRMDDAYYIIGLAVKNNVDTENMENLKN